MKCIVGIRKITAVCFAVSLSLGVMDPTAGRSEPETHPINCATAEGDLRALNAEKEHANKQQLLDVSAITPAGALLGLIVGNENKKLQILSGDYQKMLDKRIAETKAKCGIK